MTTRAPDDKKAPIEERRDQIRLPSNKSPADTMTGLTASDLRLTPLSDAEKAYQKTLSPEYDKGFNVPLKFTEGARYFLLNEEAEWTKRMRELSLPLKAGPSGHTKVFFEANRLLGTGCEPYDVRLAAIGHLLPIRAHSLIEILTVAASQGCPFTADRSMYQTLKPYSGDELRRIGRGRFPGESDEAARMANLGQAALAERLDGPTDAKATVPTAIPSTADSPSDQPVTEALASPEREPPKEPLDTSTEAEATVPSATPSTADSPSDQPVTKFLASPEREVLEAGLAKPRLSPNARNALDLAEMVAAQNRDQDRAAVEERLKEAGVNLEIYPKAYDLCEAYIRSKPLTMNFGTHLLEVIFKQPEYLNIWTLPFTQSDPKYAAGRDLTERTLHDLPPFDLGSGYGTVRKPKQEFARDLLSQPTGLAAFSKEAEAAEKGTPLGGHLPRPRGDDKKGDESWSQWYSDVRSTRKGEHQDRPISSVVNFSDYRGGGAVAYGSTHIELDESVKERATVTGQDSKDYIYQKGLGPEAVGRFTELGPVLRYMKDAAFQRLVQLAVLKMRPEDVREAEFGYIEAQIFGGIDLTRDVTRIVVDEDDLDLWAAGQLFINPMLGAGTRPARDVATIKSALESYTAKHKIPLQYIRSGKDPNRPGYEAIKNKPEHKLAVKTQWEAIAESALIVLSSKNWKGVLAACQGLSRSPAEGTFERWASPSAKTAGLVRLSAVGEDIGKLCAEKEQRATSKAKAARDEATFMIGRISVLAGDMLNAYYRFPPKEEYRPQLERLLRTGINDLADCARDLVVLPQAGSKLMEFNATLGTGVEKLWRTATLQERQHLLEIFASDPDERHMSDLGYLLEALATGPNERFRRRGLQVPAQNWLAQDKKDTSFFTWMAQDEKRALGLGDKAVKYFDDKEREAARLMVKEGKIVRASGAQLEGDIIFVMDNSNILYGAAKEAGTVQHSSFLAGRPARAAGHLILEKDGTLTGLTNESGHYRPTQRDTETAAAVLMLQGVPMGSVVVTVDKKTVNLDLERLKPVSPKEKVKKALETKRAKLLTTPRVEGSKQEELDLMIGYNSESQEDASGMAGMANAGNTCYIAAVMQLIAAQPSYSAIFTAAVQPAWSPAVKRLHSGGQGIVQKIGARQDVTIIETAGFRQALFDCGWQNGRQEQKVREQDASELFTFLLDAFNSPLGVDVSHQWQDKGSEDVKSKDESLAMLTLTGLTNGGRDRSMEDLLGSNLNVPLADKDTGALHVWTLTSLPDLLTIDLTRFDYDKEKKRIFKVSEKIHVGDSLTIPSALSPDRQEHIYELVGFIVHHGESPTTGHYTAYVKRGPSWYLCNDSSARQVSAERVNLASQDGYVFSFQQLT